MLHFYFISLISDGSWLQINLQINEESRLKEDRTRTQCLLCTAKKPHCLFLVITMVNVAIYIHLKMLYADLIIVFLLFALKKEHLFEWEYTASVAHRNKCLQLQSNLGLARIIVQSLWCLLLMYITVTPCDGSLNWRVPTICKQLIYKILSRAV